MVTQNTNELLASNISGINQGLGTIDRLQKEVSSGLKTGIDAELETYKRLAQRGKLTEKQLKRVEELRVQKAKQLVQEAGTLDVLPPEEQAFIKRKEAESKSQTTVKNVAANNSAGLSSLKNDPEKVGILLGELGSILNIPINDKGETVRERVLKEVYGANNVKLLNNKFQVSPDGQNFIDAPNASLTAQVGELGIDIVSGIGGEQLGAAAGGFLGTFGGPASPVTVPVGVAIGAGLGAGLGTGVGDAYVKTQDMVLARKLGLVDDKEIPSFIGNAGKDTAFLSALSGGITGILRAVVPAPARALARTLRVEGTTGREIGQLKAAVAEQSLVDDLFNSVKDLPEVIDMAKGQIDSSVNTFGTIAKNIVKRTKQAVLSGREKAFAEADQTFKQALEKGNFNFIDASQAYDTFSKEINGWVRQKLLDQNTADLILDKIGSQLNFTKNEVLQGFLPASKATIQRFGAEGFDPSKATALDFRNISNVIDSLYDDVPKQVQKTLSQFRVAIDRGIGESAKNIDPKLLRNNPFISGVKAPAQSIHFDNYRKAFQKSGERFTALPEKLWNLTDDVSPSEVGQMVRQLSPEDAKKFSVLVDQLPAEQQQLFKKSLRFNILNDSKTINRQRTRNVVQDISKEAKQQAFATTKQGVQELEEKGIKGQIKPVKESIAGFGDGAGVSKERAIIGKGLSDAMQFNKTDNILLGKQAKGLQKAGNKLALLQDQAGRVSTLQDTSGTAFNQAGDIAQTFTEFLPKGQVVSRAASALINPAQRAAATGIEALASPLNPFSKGSALLIKDLLGGEDEAVKNRLKQATFSNR